MAYVTTKEDVKRLIEIWPKYETKKQVIQAMGSRYPEGWVDRMIFALRACKVDLPKKRSSKTRLIDMVKEIMAEK